MMKDGDIFFWSWKDSESRFMPYHCYSRKAIVADGCLVDTFWSTGGSNAVLDLEKVDVSYQGNQNEMETIHASEIDYYRPEDVVDMRHSNDSRAPIYIKGGAVRNQEAVLSHLRYKRERAEADIRYAQGLIQQLDEAIAAAECGQLDGVYL